MRLRTRIGRLRVPLLAAAALALVCAAAPASANVPGVLTKAGCVVQGEAREGCTTVRGIANTAYLVLSPDGRHLYATGRDSDSVAAFARNLRTGALTQLPGAAGCVARDPAAEGCTAAPGLDRATSVAISPEGTHLYVTGSDGDTLTILARDAASGAVTPVGCLVDADRTLAGCAPAQNLDGAIAVVVSVDGRSVYVASRDADAVSAFARDPASGALTQVGCISDLSKAANDGCAKGPGLLGAFGITASPDGRNVYVASADSQGVVSLGRDPATGALTHLGCLSSRGTRQDKNCTAAPVPLEYAQNVIVTPDGFTAYVAATDTHTVVALARDQTTGALAPLPAPEGCIGDWVEAPTKCPGVSGLALPLGLAMTRDGRSLYTGAFGYGTVASFTRDPRTAVLSQLGACLGGDARCTTTPVMARTGWVALSPDDRFLYANATSESAINVFARSLRLRPARASTRSARVRRGAVTVQVACPRAAREGCLAKVHAAVVNTLGRVTITPVTQTVEILLAAGETGSVRLPVKARVLRGLPAGPVRARVIVVTRDGAGAEATGEGALTIRR